jgi:hypothetical protein
MACREKNNYIRDNCPNRCFNATHYNRVRGSICNIYNNKYLCNVAERRRKIARDCARKNISILNNDKNTMKIRNGGKYNIYNVNQKPTAPQFRNAEERSYYNSVFNKVLNSVKTTFYDQRLRKKTGINAKQRQILLNYANQYAVMMLRRHYASYGATNDGWPAVSITGSEVPMFSENHDGYGNKNCCLTSTDKAQIRQALTNGRTFCKITKGKCSKCNCGYLRSIA